MNVQIIIGSTRPNRISPQVAEWVRIHLPQRDEVTYELVDVSAYNLPLFDEPQHPIYGTYSHDYTQKWSDKIKQADALIFLVPEYNAGYPASLKNAIDYLYHEWTGKPAMVVSYGTRGGMSASAQFQQVLTRLKMKVTGISPSLEISREVSEEGVKVEQLNELFKAFEPLLDEAAQELLNGSEADEAVTD